MSFTPFYRRRFLNRRGHHGGAYVIASVDLDSWPGDADRHLEAALTISDYSRVTVLDCDARDPREMANSLAKARSLQAVVNDFVEALESAVEELGRAESR